MIVDSWTFWVQFDYLLPDYIILGTMGWLGKQSYLFRGYVSEPSVLTPLFNFQKVKGRLFTCGALKIKQKEINRMKRCFLSQK